MGSLFNSIKDIFSAIKPYKKNIGEPTGISEIDALGYDYLSSTIYSITNDKKSLFKEYKEMSMFPEIADAVDEIVFEGIISDQNNQVVSLKILDTDLAGNENVVQNLQKEFDYVVSTLLDFNTNAEDLFRKFFIEGELYAEMLVTKDKKEKGITGLQFLPSYTMRVEYDDRQNPCKFIQDLTSLYIARTKENEEKMRSLNDNKVTFLPSQIAYVNSGIVDFRRGLVYSYLERAKVVYRQLKWMENALVIYRIVRAPERRVFYIDTGKLPKNKADQYIRDIVRKYKNRKIYNPSTGEIDVGKDVMTMQEDFFFPVGADGRGSKVDTLEGGQNLSEIADIVYFLKKLYRALKIPATRLLEDDKYNPGKMGEITRDEIKFSKYVEKIRKRFVDFIYQIFLVHLQLKGLYSQYNLSKNKISIKFNENNAWKELKNLELKKARVELLKDLSDNPSELFSKDYLYKEVMNLSDDEVKNIKEVMATEGSNTAPAAEEKPEEEGKKKEIGTKIIGEPELVKDKKKVVIASLEEPKTFSQYIENKGKR